MTRGTRPRLAALLACHASAGCAVSYPDPLPLVGDWITTSNVVLHVEEDLSARACFAVPTLEGFSPVGATLPVLHTLATPAIPLDLLTLRIEQDVFDRYSMRVAAVVASAVEDELLDHLGPVFQVVARQVLDAQYFARFCTVETSPRTMACDTPLLGAFHWTALGESARRCLVVKEAAPLCDVLQKELQDRCPTTPAGPDVRESAADLGVDACGLLRDACEVASGPQGGG